MRGRNRLRRMVGTGTGALVLAVVRARGRSGRAAMPSAATMRTVVHACYRVPRTARRLRSALLRVVPGDATCRRNERSLVWNLKGAQGPPGPPGRRRPGRSGRPGRSRRARRPARARPPGAATSSAASPRR